MSFIQYLSTSCKKTAPSYIVAKTRHVAIFVLTVVCAISSFLTLSGCASPAEGIPTLGSAKLSTPDISVADTLRVGVNSKNSPLAGKSGDKIIGIDVDIAAALADELGLKVDIIDVGSDGAKALKNNKVDIVLGVESTTKEEGVWVSSQYLQSGIVLFANGDSNIEVPSVSSHPKIAAQVSSKSAWAVTNIFGDDSLQTATDLAAAFSTLVNKNVKYVASDAIIGLYASHKQNYNVEICALLESPSGYSVMVSDDNTPLKNAIQEGLAQISDTGIIGVIEDKWLGQTVNLTGISKVEGTKSASQTGTSTEGIQSAVEATVSGQSNGSGTTINATISSASDTTA